MTSSPDTSGILVCAGNATRMQGQNKILLPLGQTNVIGMSMLAMEHCDRIAEFIVVARPSDHDAIQKTIADLQLKKCSAIVPGGATRQESVLNGVRAASKETKLFAIHDGARPLVKPEHIAAVIHDAEVFGGATLGVPVKDTIKVVNDGLIVDTPYRPNLYSTQTPQVFQKRIYFEAVDFALEHHLDFTDDCQLAEAINCKVYKIRIGHGYDVHRLVENRKLILGGVEIPFERGLLGHSDADVLLHAISDALLGAVALGDIGKHFPDTDPRYAGADSMLLLKEVVQLVRNEGYQVGNLDATILCQRPKLAGFISAMRENIAACCEIPVSDVSVKATTEEKLGFTGSGEGIAVHAVALLERID